MEIKHTPEQPIGQRRNQKGNKQYLETNQNENTTYQNSSAVAKAVLRGKFVPINVYIKEKEISQINDLMLT